MLTQSSPANRIQACLHACPVVAGATPRMKRSNGDAGLEDRHNNSKRARVCSSTDLLHEVQTESIRVRCQGPNHVEYGNMIGLVDYCRGSLKEPRVIKTTKQGKPVKKNKKMTSLEFCQRALPGNYGEFLHCIQLNTPICGLQVGDSLEKVHTILIMMQCYWWSRSLHDLYVQARPECGHSCDTRANTV